MVLGGGIVQSTLFINDESPGQYESRYDDTGQGDGSEFCGCIERIHVPGGFVGIGQDARRWNECGHAWYASDRHDEQRRCLRDGERSKDGWGIAVCGGDVVSTVHDYQR